MNKKSIFLIILLLAGLLLINVNKVKADNQITTDAEIDQQTQNIVDNEATDPDLVNVGTTPDQAGYGLKLALEKIRLALTFNRAKKTELSLQLAELRVKEARLMAAKNNLEGLQRSKEEHKKYLDLVEKQLGKLDESQKSIKDQARIESKLEDQKNQVDELESLILIKTKGLGLTDEQKNKLLALIDEFKAQNDNIEIKIMNKKDLIKTRLKAQGLKEEDIEDEFEQEKNETRNLTREDILERKATHQIEQSQKMYDLASRLIDKFQNRQEGNGEDNNTEDDNGEDDNSGNSSNRTRNITFTLDPRTLELHAKAKDALDKAKSELNNKNYFKAIELARESKKLSALTIASIHGNFNNEKLEDRLEKIIKEGMKKEERVGELKEKQQELERQLREKMQERLKKRTECSKEDCGPALGMPSYVCQDGSIGGFTGRCLRNIEGEGKCSWQIRTCLLKAGTNTLEPPIQNTNESRNNTSG